MSYRMLTKIYLIASKSSAKGAKVKWRQPQSGKSMVCMGIYVVPFASALGWRDPKLVKRLVSGDENAVSS